MRPPKQPFPSFTLALSRQSSEAAINAIESRERRVLAQDPLQTFDPRTVYYCDFDKPGTTTTYSAWGYEEDVDKSDTETIFEERLDSDGGSGYGEKDIDLDDGARRTSKESQRCSCTGSKTSHDRHHKKGGLRRLRTLSTAFRALGCFTCSGGGSGDGRVSGNATQNPRKTA